MSAEIELSHLGGKVSLSLYGVIDGVTNIAGTLIGIVSEEAAVMDVTSGVVANFHNILPMLPQVVRASLNNSYTSIKYLIVSTDEGRTYYIGIPWIIEGSYVVG